MKTIKNKERAQALLNASLLAQEKFKMYILGCKDALGLDGDYSLNTQTWEFEPAKKEGD